MTHNIYAKSNNYTIYGNISTSASTGANTVKGKKTGKYIIEFKDGVRHEVHFPTIHIKGITVGKRTFNFKHSCVVCDTTANLASFIKINPDEKGGFISFFTSKQKTYPDTLRYL